MGMSGQFSNNGASAATPPRRTTPPIVRVHWRSLPDPVKDNLAAVSYSEVHRSRAMGDPRVPLLAHRGRRSRAWVYGIVAAAAAVIGVMIWRSELGAVDEPGFGDKGVVVFSLVAALAIVPGILLVQHLLPRLRRPIAPGVYLTATDLIDTRDEAIRIAPVHSCAVKERVHGLWLLPGLRVYSHSTLLFVPPIGGAFAFPLLKRAEIAEVEAALAAFAGDPAARSAADVFAAVRLPDGRLDLAAAHLPAKRSQVFRSAASIAIALAIAVPVGWSVAELRQRAHDDAAFASARTRGQRQAYARWGRRGAEVRAALRLDRPGGSP